MVTVLLALPPKLSMYTFLLHIDLLGKFWSQNLWNERSFLNKLSVTMLRNKFGVCKIMLNIVFSMQFVSYCPAGQAGASVAVCCQLLTVQAGTELKTPQMLNGKRKWCDLTLSWTQYRKWRWSVVSQLCQHTARFSSFGMWPYHWVYISNVV